MTTMNIESKPRTGPAALQQTTSASALAATAQRTNRSDQKSAAAPLTSIAAPTGKGGRQPIARVDWIGPLIDDIRQEIENALADRQWRSTDAVRQVAPRSDGVVTLLEVREVMNTQRLPQHSVYTSAYPDTAHAQTTQPTPPHRDDWA